MYTAAMRMELADSLFELGIITTANEYFEILISGSAHITELQNKLKGQARSPIPTFEKEEDYYTWLANRE